MPKGRRRRPLGALPPEQDLEGVLPPEADSVPLRLAAAGCLQAEAQGLTGDADRLLEQVQTAAPELGEQLERELQRLRARRKRRDLEEKLQPLAQRRQDKATKALQKRARKVAARVLGHLEPRKRTAAEVAADLELEAERFRRRGLLRNADLEALRKWHGLHFGAAEQLEELEQAREAARGAA